MLVKINSHSMEVKVSQMTPLGQYGEVRCDYVKMWKAPVEDECLAFVDCYIESGREIGCFLTDELVVNGKEVNIATLYASDYLNPVIRSRWAEK